MGLALGRMVDGFLLHAKEEAEERHSRRQRQEDSADPSHLLEAACLSSRTAIEAKSYHDVSDAVSDQ